MTCGHGRLAGVTREQRERAADGVEDLLRSHLSLGGPVVRETLDAVPTAVADEDLRGAGRLGLVVAVATHDVGRRSSFRTYAALCVRSAVVEELRKADAAALPDAERFHPSAEDEVLRAERLAYLRAAVAELPQRLRFLVVEHFFAERPLNELARTLGVSESRVSELRADALTALRDALDHAFAPNRVRPMRRPRGAAARRREAYFAAVDDRHTSGRQATRGRTGILAADRSAAG